ncbi:unnamed protein product [Meloidogyne enterolobii]|uniref:Uncharacterized protein n=1 Tax=Meloidogyne enterolobii TaxID=390850 RepID=A0ACB1AJQ6_MELEN
MIHKCSKASAGPGWYWDVGLVACDVKVLRGDAGEYLRRGG